MSLKIKLFNTLFTVSILAWSFWLAYDNYTKKLSLNYNLGQFQFALKKLPELFVRGIIIVNYDLIEHQFQEANEILKNIQTLDEEKYTKLKADFEILKGQKERYKARSSQIAMSFLLLQKWVKETTSPKSEEMQIYLLLLESCHKIFNKDELKRLLEASKNLDGAFKKHVELLLENLYSENTLRADK